MPEMKVVVDCATGEQTEVPMSPQEEAALLALREAANQPPPPNPLTILRSLLEFTEGPEDLKLILDAQFELLGG